MRRIYAALLLCFPAFGSWFWHEWIKEVFWEGVLHVLNPENSLLLQYGPPVIFAAVVFYILLGIDRKRSRAAMLSIAMMIGGTVLLIGGVLLYYGETGHLPFSEKKEKNEISDKFKSEPQASASQSKEPNVEQATKIVSSVFIDCTISNWMEAEQKQQDGEILLGSYTAQSFNGPAIFFGLASGPVNNHNHMLPKSSSIPLKCVMSFYGYAPIFNLELKIFFHLYEAVRAPNSVQNGRDPFLTTDSILRIKQIDQTKKYTFYIYSFDVDAFIGVSYPNNFLFSTFEDSQRHEGKILRPSGPFDFALAQPQIAMPK